MTLEPSMDQRRQLGAYYTDQAVARFLVDAVVETGSERVLEPSFGNGAFIAAWHDVVGDGAGAIVGCDIDADVVTAVSRRFGFASLHCGDFFEAAPGEWGSFDAVVGNPPFVRLTRLPMDARIRAVETARRAGVAFPLNASVWAPFLVHATQHLRPGGRLAVVAPLELTYARYARPLREYLCRHFGAVRLITFDRPLFPELDQATVVMVARNWGQSTDAVEIVCVDSFAELVERPRGAGRARQLALHDWQGDLTRAAELKLPALIRSLYEEVARESPRLGDLAKITIGYVTGGNGWFHLDGVDVARLGLNADVGLVIRRGRDIRQMGLTMTLNDHQALAAGPNWLFIPREPLSGAAQSRIADGEQLGVSGGYKCGRRDPWWRVPDVRPHDFIVGVLAADHHRVVAVDLPATNGFLVGDMVQPIHPQVLAAASLTSLAQLSAELVGHPLGGGALKLEPNEARRWVLPTAPFVPWKVLAQIDLALRSGDRGMATRIANRFFLGDHLGLSTTDIETLDRGARILRSWRSRFP